MCDISEKFRFHPIRERTGIPFEFPLPQDVVNDREILDFLKGIYSDKGSHIIVTVLYNPQPILRFVRKKEEEYIDTSGYDGWLNPGDI